MKSFSIYIISYHKYLNIVIITIYILKTILLFTVLVYVVRILISQGHILIYKEVNFFLNI